jgi:hypothetical protein
MPQQDTVYKYTSENAARLIIANRTLRFGRPSAMNDPFDINIDDLFETALTDWRNAEVAILVDMLSANPAEYAERVGVPPEDAIAISGIINAGTAAQREELLAILTSPVIDDMYPQLKAMFEALESEKSAIVTQFKNSGIFCATRNKSNLLMWTHYADQHKGVALGFHPDIARDSFLRLLEPVSYSNIRPRFYRPLDPLVRSTPSSDPDAMRAFTRSLTHVKSTEWAYEEEVRVVIPDCIPAGQDATFLPYYPTELVELNIGHRLTGEARDKLVAAAVALNEDVSIFQARMTAGAYSLSFERIA